MYPENQEKVKEGPCTPIAEEADIMTLKNNTRLNYPLSLWKKTALGSLQVAIGILTFFFSYINLITGSLSVFCGLASYLSVFTNVIAGILGIMTGSIPTRCRVQGNLVICILGALACFISITLAVAQILMFCQKGEGKGLFCDDDYCLLHFAQTVLIYTTLAVAHLLLAVIAIISSYFDCRAVCCCRTKDYADYENSYRYRLLAQYEDSDTHSLADAHR